MRADRPPIESVAAMALDDEFEFRSAVRRGVTRACTEDTAVVYVCGRVCVWCGVVWLRSNGRKRKKG